MAVPRIHVDAELSAGTELALPPAAARHVARVLRLRAGAPLRLFHGRGGEYTATIVAVGRDAARVRIDAHHPRECESPLDIALVQGVSRGDRMDYAVQKAVELGARRIVPVITARSVVQLEGARAERRREHWQHVAIGACEQCGRNRIPLVETPLPLDRWLQGWGGGAGLLLSPRAEAGIGSLPRPAGPLALLIGPEGGLSEREEAKALERGFTAVRLGPRILRTETAAVAVLATLQARWGDFGL